MDRMKSYSIDSDVRIKAVFATAILAIALTMMLYVPTNQVISGLVTSVPTLAPLQQFGILNALEPALFFCGLWSLFDTVVWRWPPLRRWHHIPFLGGKWKGVLKSSYSANDEGGHLTKSFAMDINQTFSKMSICCAFPGSSESYAEVIGVAECDSFRKACTLKFVYINSATDESVAFDPGRDSTHLGLNVLHFVEGVAKGHYYTCRNKPTNGYIEIERMQ